jgi:hypothetical protein
MRERIRAETIEHFGVEHRREIMPCANELQFARRRIERAQIVALRMNASR